MIKKNKFEEAAGHFNEAARIFEKSKTDILSKRFLGKIPLIKNELQTLQELFSVGIVLSKTSANFSYFAEDLFSPFEGGEIRLSELDPVKRRVFLRKLHESPPIFYGTKAEIALSLLSLESLRPGLVHLILQEKLDQVREGLRMTNQFLEDALPLFELFPRLAGYPEEQTYLFLMQNNTELRPSGGFIGAYGILRMKDGQLVDLFIDDSYNLDRLVDPKTRPFAPAPIKQYMTLERWYFRDVNWSPDFRESAELALKFYREESGREEKINGVIAITPDVISSILKIIGPQTIDGQTFTDKNFVDALEWEVEVGYLEKGILKPQRKAIIGVLAYQIIDQLHFITWQDWLSIVHDLRQNLDEKHVLIYALDSDLQQFVELRDWGGRVKDIAGDYLMVIDANLASLKTDPVVERSIYYSLNQDGNDILATLRIIYVNKGTFTWKTTRYRTYTRIYVPKGSILLESKGAMIKEKDLRPGAVDIDEEMNKTVFGAFISIEPRETRELEFRYKLPENVVNSFLSQGAYKLLIQKQSGVQDRDLTISLNLGKKILQWSPTGFNVAVDDVKINWETKLRKDQIFEVSF